jgi:hypothetical protein
MDTLQPLVNVLFDVVKGILQHERRVKNKF